MLNDRRIKLELIKLKKNLAFTHYSITPEFIKGLPVQTLSAARMSLRVGSKYFNPIYFYPKEVKILKNECGHDKQARYLLKVTIN